MITLTLGLSLKAESIFKSLESGGGEDSPPAHEQEEARMCVWTRKGIFITVRVRFLAPKQQLTGYSSPGYRVSAGPEYQLAGSRP